MEVVQTCRKSCQGRAREGRPGVEKSDGTLYPSSPPRRFSCPSILSSSTSSSVPVLLLLHLLHPSSLSQFLFCLPCLCSPCSLSLRVSAPSSVQFSRSVMSDSVTKWTAACQASLSVTNPQSLPKLMSIELGMQPTISSSIVPFSSCPQSFPASGSFQMSQLFASGGQRTGVSASA